MKLQNMMKLSTETVLNAQKEKAKGDRNAAGGRAITDDVYQVVEHVSEHDTLPNL